MPAFLRNILLIPAIAFLVLPTLQSHADENATTHVDEAKLDGLKCFIMVKKDVKGKKTLEYKDGTLYLCCSSCVKRIQKKPEKYEANSNRQLVYLGQYKQTLCPLTGSEITKDSPEFKVDGGVTGVVNVHVASEGEVKKLSEMDLEAQVEALFGPEGFAKGKFVVVKATPEK